MSEKSTFKIKLICPGAFSAPSLITRERISLLGGVDAEAGTFCDPRSELKGLPFRRKVLIFTSGKGSSLWSSIFANTRRSGTAPAAIINLELDTFVVFACVVNDIPMLQLLEPDAFDHIKNGDLITYDGASDEIIVEHV